MSTPDFELHRAIVHWSDPTTGFAQVRVPTLLGAESVVYIPNTGLTESGGVWNVPAEGTSTFIAVSHDRTQFLWLTALGAGGGGAAGVPAATGEPMGHQERTDSAVSFNDSTRTFSIQPVGDSYTVWCKGTKYDKTELETVTVPDSTDLYYIYFDPDGALQYRTSYFVWDEDCPTAYVYWNATTQKAEFFADERHGIVLDWQTHEYLHRTRGAAIANGFDLDPTKFIIDGDGSLDGDCYWGMYGNGNPVGTFFDEDLQVDIINSATPTANTWEQFLEAPAEIPVFYKESYGWVKNTATNFPFKSGPNRPYYNSIGDLSYLTEIDTNKFGIAWIVATNNLNDPVLAIMGQDQYLNIGDAEAVDWNSLDLTDLPIVEMRPLYKYVFQTKDTYTNSVKAALRGLYDIRRIESSAGAPSAAESLAAAIQNLLVPAGTVSATIRTTADTGWLMLDGSSVASAASLYPSLWEVSPASWKSGTTLTLPNMTNRTLEGSGVTSLGVLGGSNSVSLATANLPAHNHSINHGHADNFTANQSQHRHSVDPPSTTTSTHSDGTNYLYEVGSGAYRFGNGGDIEGQFLTISNHSHTVNIPAFNSGYTDPAITISGGVTNHAGNSGNTGSGTSVDVTNAHLAVNFQIKAH